MNTKPNAPSATGQNTEPGQICDIPDWGLLEVRGADAEKFLQGQLTCDLRQLATQAYIDGALCTHQGRVLATFRLFRNETAVYLRMPRDLIATICTHLARYAAFFAVELREANDIKGLALLEIGSPPPVPDNLPLVAQLDTPSGREYWGTAEHLAGLRRLLLQQAAPAPAERWQAALIRSGSAQIFRATSGEFLAHQMSLDLAGAISFRKGCYTGQEIIARTQYRGKSKKRLAALLVQDGEPKSWRPGEELLHEDGHPLGHLLFAVADQHGLLAQAILPEALPGDGFLMLGGARVRYQRLPLPFSVDPPA